MYLWLQLVPHREHSLVTCHFNNVNCFFGFSSYLKKDTVSFVSCHFNNLNCFFGFSSYLTENTVSLVSCHFNNVNCFFGYSSYLTENTVSLVSRHFNNVNCFFGFISYLTKTQSLLLVVTLITWIVSSAPARTSQRTHYLLLVVTLITWAVSLSHCMQDTVNLHYYDNHWHEYYSCQFRFRLKFRPNLNLFDTFYQKSPK